MKKSAAIILVLIGLSSLQAKTYYQCDRYLNKADENIRKAENTHMTNRATAYSTMAIAYIKRYEACVQKLKDKEKL